MVGGGGKATNTDGQGNPRPDMTAVSGKNGWAVWVEPSDGGTFAYPVSLEIYTICVNGTLPAAVS